MFAQMFAWKDIIMHLQSLCKTSFGHGDIIFHDPFNLSFVNNLESIHYKATLAIIICFHGTSRDKLYQELGLESLPDRLWARKLSFFNKILNGLAAPFKQSRSSFAYYMLQNS